jgi:hypothetical protein
LKPRCAHLRCQGWLDVTQGSDTINVLGAGFGELIKPNDTCKGCGKPSIALPPGHDFLATPTHMLKSSAERYGTVSSKCFELVKGVFWFEPETVRGRSKPSPTNIAGCVCPSVGLQRRSAVLFGSSSEAPMKEQTPGDPPRSPALIIGQHDDLKRARIAFHLAELELAKNKHGQCSERSTDRLFLQRLEGATDQPEDSSLHVEAPNDRDSSSLYSEEVQISGTNLSQSSSNTSQNRSAETTVNGDESTQASTATLEFPQGSKSATNTVPKSHTPHSSGTRRQEDPDAGLDDGRCEGSSRQLHGQSSVSLHVTQTPASPSALGSMPTDDLLRLSKKITDIVESRDRIQDVLGHTRTSEFDVSSGPQPSEIDAVNSDDFIAAIHGPSASQGPAKSSGTKEAHHNEDRNQQADQARPESFSAATKPGTPGPRGSPSSADTQPKSASKTPGRGLLAKLSILRESKGRPPDTCYASLQTSGS